MNIFTIQLFEEHEKCSFYTVVKDGQSKSETDLFFEKHAESHRAELLDFIKLLEYIGNERGANEHLFRFEGQALALPKNERRQKQFLEIDFKEFPLRLFCLRISDALIIFFNGGIKDAQTAQESSLSAQFREANQFAKAIDKAIIQKDIEINNHILIGENTVEIYY
ncbi:hypothetical protein KUV50_16650 [Membranicola marinus]|uniref:Uncharacterized protein n=1 Tax=Membranihabitans marinus TaxID=1227546 RepID=A0A953LCR6_9BACT|nr:hypothetical protein [Membranihabitans marinus]MBY5959786.1 hypothetical protein [Membranihabitans marinus]